MAELQEQFNALQQNHNVLQEQFNALQPNHTALQEQFNALQQNHTALQEQFNALQPNHTALQEQLNALQQNHTALQEQLNNLQQNHTALQEQFNNLQQSHTALEEEHKVMKQQLDDSQAKLTFYKNEQDAITDKYNQLANISGIDKLRDLFKKLTDLQTEALHTHTHFRVDTFETLHSKQQVQCSTQFIQLILTQLKSSVDEVIQREQNMLAQRKHANVSAFEAFTTGNVPKVTIDACIKPLETEIEQIQARIGEWKTFATDLNGVLNLNQSISIPVSPTESEVDDVSNQKLHNTTDISSVPIDFS